MAGEVSTPWWEAAGEWIGAHPALLGWVFVGSIVMLVASALLVPLVVGRLPVDEFAHNRPPPHPWRDLHPALALSLRIARNGFGALCVLAGIAMLMLPGQGLLTIFVGVLLLEFPGKRRLVLSVVRRRPVQRSLNWLRRHRGVPEFVFDDPETTD